MVSHPGEYLWSSYRVNALGEEDVAELLKPHSEYVALDKNAGKRYASYRALFKTRISEKTLADIRESTNKSWALGSEKFKARIEKRTGRVATPRARGGDRKSSFYLKGINGV